MRPNVTRAAAAPDKRGIFENNLVFSFITETRPAATAPTARETPVDDNTASFLSVLTFTGL